MTNEEAVQALKAHFEKTARGEKLGEEDVRTFMGASEVVVHHVPSAAVFGSWVLAHVLAQYRAQLDAAQK